MKAQRTKTEFWLLKAALSVLLLSAQAVSAQLFTDTLPTNRNAVLEAFTAVHCSYCPAAHHTLDSIIAVRPGRIFAVSMHPSNVSYTAPYPGSPDFRRGFCNALFVNPFATDSLRYFPGAFINRVSWQPGKREQISARWLRYSDTILAKPSPLNLGIRASYSTAGALLQVDVQVYFTDTVSDSLQLNVYLAEDSLIAEQSNGGSQYLHMHVFREAFSSQWGDTIHGVYLPGRYYTMNYHFTNLPGYNIHHSYIMTFVGRAGGQEVVTGLSSQIDEIIVGENTERINPEINLYPNPCTQQIHICFGQQMEGVKHLVIYDISGRSLMEYTTEAADFTCPTNALCPGIYFFRIQGKNSFTSARFVVSSL